MPVAFEIVCPDQQFLAADADMVVIPAAEGDMGVLEGHTPVLVTLRGGVVAMYEGERITRQWFVAGGFAEVTPTRCVVLANEVTPVAELNLADAERAAREAEDAYAAALPDPDVQQLALDRVQAARAMVEAATARLAH